MYCRKCGCRMPDGAVKCPDCGTDAKGNEYCGGFWGLVGKENMSCNAEDSTFPDESEENIPVLQPLDTEQEEQKELVSSYNGNDSRKSKFTKPSGITVHLSAILLGGVAVVFLVLFLVQTGKVSALSKELKENLEKIDELQNQIDAERQKTPWEKIFGDWGTRREGLNGNSDISSEDGDNEISGQSSSPEPMNNTDLTPISLPNYAFSPTPTSELLLDPGLNSITEPRNGSGLTTTPKLEPQNIPDSTFPSE